MVDGIQELVQALQTDTAEPSKTYHAEVSHIDGDGTVWVYLEGATKETPTATASTEVKAGDFVSVEWRNNKLYIAGNISNPSAGIVTVRPSVDYVNDLIDKDITVNSINAATGYIGDLTADHITAGDISASAGYIKDLTSENITAQDIVSDHAEIGDLDVNYAKVDGANIDSATIQNAWVNKILVQTGLIAHEGTVFTLDAIQVNAANITAGTLDVNRLIVTVEDQKYLVNIDPTTGTPSYQKLDGNIVEPRTLTADKIVAGAITTNEITTNNLQGTSGWINLHDGTFFYGNGVNFATATNAISWNGSKLQIKADEFLLSSGKTIQEEIEAVENWFYSVPPTTSNEPAKNWTTTSLKEQHLRDIYFDTTSGKSYRWSKDGNVYSWVEIQDVELAALANDLHNNYPPRSEFTIAPNQINAEVSKKVGNDEVIAKINASVEEQGGSAVRISADKVNIEGAAIFNSGRLSTTSLNNTYDAKDSAGTVQANLDKLEVGGKNYLVANDSFINRVETTESFDFSGWVYILWSKTWVNEHLTQGEDYILSFDATLIAVPSGYTASEEYRPAPILFQQDIPNMHITNASGEAVYGGTDTYELNETRHYQMRFTFTPSGDSQQEYFGLAGYTVLRRNGSGDIAYDTFRISNLKLEKGNKATDWTPAPEDVQAEIDAKKSVHTLTTNYSYTYAQILTYSGEGNTSHGAWAVTSASGVKVGDTVRLKVTVSNMNNAPVYVIGTVTAVSGNNVTMTSHGVDTTIIDGGNILTNSIGANQIKSNAIDTSRLTVGAQDAMLNSNIEVGGRNLVWDTAWKNLTTRWTNWGTPPTREIVTVNGKRCLHLVTNTTRYQGYQQNESKRNGYGEIKAGDKVVVSLFAHAAVANQIASIGIHWRDSSGTIIGQNWHGWGLTTTAQRYTSSIFTVPDGAVGFNIMIGANTNTAQELWISEVKMEFGTKATDWTPAPEDLEAYTDTKTSELRADMDESIDGSIFYQYTVGNITYDVWYDEDDKKYYYINSSGTQQTVAESSLDISDGQKVTIRKNGLEDAVTEANKNLEEGLDSMGARIDLASSNLLSNIDAVSDTLDIEKQKLKTEIDGLSDSLAKVEDYVMTVNGKVKISDSILIGDPLSSNIQIADEAINLRKAETVLASMDSEQLNIETANVTYLRLGKFILESMSDGSLVLKER